MNITKIKYCVAVAAVMVAAAFCGCDDKDAEIIEIESVDAPEAEIQGQERILGAVVESAEKTADKTVRVYVCGAVKTPDVYELPASARMTDAVDAAGGFSRDAAMEYLNLAAPLSDGQKVYIPTNSEVEDAISQGMAIYGSEVNITSNSPGIMSGATQAQGEDVGAPDGAEIQQNRNKSNK